MKKVGFCIDLTPNDVFLIFVDVHCPILLSTMTSFHAHLSTPNWVLARH